MRIYLTAGVLIGMLAGCSSDQAPVAGKAAVAAGENVAGAMQPSAFRAPMSGFASLPDRGELLAYEQVRQVKHKGAYTAYPVAISETHALRAMQSGEMVVNAPNGESIRLKYERHEESPDGNWTWIGRNADGASAVITFGEKAVFGVIPQGTADTLRLTMNAGQSWLVQTDRSKLAGRDGATVREGGDQLIPPKLAGSGSVSGPSMQAAPVSEGASAATAVVDILLGYTNGYAAQLGGQSQANTRLVNMTAITNEAYTNSGVSMRVRLVKTLQVNYPDNTDNGDALEKLTGYKAGTGGGPITPDPAFNALRAARDESGADLVSLVRAFRTPENAGCGIAWLIGGGETGIVQADAPFGYSVVSDGTDLDEGDDNTYFCREETLAHELGHNMGQAHNEDDSSSTGVHAYSYGYREASSSGFYTVMAYPQADGNQFSIRYFANPNVKYLNRATGVANQSDNVRSLNQVMPTISTFRSTVVPVQSRVRFDFNGDGRSDLFWRNLGSGGNQIWKSANSATPQPIYSVSSAWEAVGVADFDGDGKADILWRNDHMNVIWKSGNGATKQSVTPLSAEWQVAGVGDFDGDGKADILWRQGGSTGWNVIWRSAYSPAKISVSPLGTQWRAVGIADFDGDGKDDILWRNLTTGENRIWKSANSSTTQPIYSISTAWQMAGVGDFDGDGKADILWREASQGWNVIWKGGNGATKLSVLPTSSQWRVGAIGDFDGDGKADIMWRQTVPTGWNTIWKSANGFTKQSVSPMSLQWTAIR